MLANLCTGMFMMARPSDKTQNPTSQPNSCQTWTEASLLILEENAAKEKTTPIKTQCGRPEERTTFSTCILAKIAATKSYFAVNKMIEIDNRGSGDTKLEFIFAH